MVVDITAEQLLSAALKLAKTQRVAVLDSCAVGNLGSRFLIIGIQPEEVIEFTEPADDLPEKIRQSIERPGKAAIVTFSYELGHVIQNTSDLRDGRPSLNEPLAYLALFDTLAVHDYLTGQTRICGNTEKTRQAAEILGRSATKLEYSDAQETIAFSNFSHDEYVNSILEIQEEIRKGNTYQTNLTQQISVKLPSEISPFDIFLRLRRDHPAPFSAFISRGHSHVISASPERLVRVNGRTISASPIKGTRPRGSDSLEDERLREELVASIEDRSENIMIVDLLRNDLGMICEFGSVEVEKLCDIEVHPTLFHLVSTIKGRLRKDIGIDQIIRSVFPCGSITGAPKRSTMSVIDRLEPSKRGLSMGSIGIVVPEGFDGLSPMIDLSVAIRTMVLKDDTAIFNVGGGIVIDSDAELEYEESLLKAKALLAALGSKN